MIRILFVIPYKEGEAVVQEVLAEKAYKKEIQYETLVAGVGERLTISQDRADAIISRGYTAATLKTVQPKIELRVTGFDIVRAVKECIDQYKCKKIAVIGTFHMVYGADSIQDLFDNAQVQCVTLEQEELLLPTMKKLQKQGTDAFIGGRSLYNTAKTMGISAVLLGFGREAVNKSIDEAIRAVEISRSEKAKSHRIQTIMDYAFEGILSADSQGTVVMANQYAANVLSGEKTEIIDQSIFKLFSGLPVDQVLKKGEHLLSCMYRLEKMTVSVNCVPLITKGEITGCVATFQDITRIQEEEEKIRKQLHRKGFVAKYQFENIIGSCRQMKDTIKTAEKFAGSDLNLYIYGETGTGKELFAQSIHNASKRKNGPFVAINCAALPENLLESELFGYVDGAFTGAAKGGKKGLFELAHNGTLFLDEIGEMSLKLQARLLRVIQEREIMRLGDSKVIPVNVRVISASNKELYQAVEEGNFRQDLLYRLNVLCLSVPPLRERGKDVLALIQYYINKAVRDHCCTIYGIQKEAEHLILEYSWPGNVRELRNFCERLSVFCEDKLADEATVKTAIYSGRSGEAWSAEKNRESQSYKIEEKEKIISALKQCNYSRKRTAALLEIDSSTLYRKMKKYEIEV